MNNEKAIICSEEFSQMKKIQLSLLKKFIEICETHNIKYYAIYGTLLGTVRHQGYIPWDDDIDIAIWRKDVKKIKKIAKKELVYPYKFIFSDEKNDFYCGIIKFQNLDSAIVDLDFFSEKGLYGIFIDVEVIDYTFCNRYFRRLKHFVLQFVYDLIFIKQYGTNYYGVRWTYKKKLKKWLARILNRRMLISLSEHVQRWHGLNRKYCSIYTYNQHHNLRVEWFQEGKKMPFEDIKINIPNKYEACLKSFYGDNYHILPPEEARKPSHLSGFKYLAPYNTSTEAVECLTNFIKASEGKFRIIWGAGNMLEHYMLHYGDICKPDYIIDNNSDLWGKRKYECDICSPKILQQFQPNDVHIIICNIYYNEIARQIRSLGNYTFSIYWENYVNRISKK